MRSLVSASIFACILALGCQPPTNVEWLPPPPYSLPHNWLRKIESLEEVTRNVDHRVKAGDTQLQSAFEKFKSCVKTGDEIWSWETEPYNFNHAHTGYCITRSSKIIEVLYLGEIVWIDEP